MKKILTLLLICMVLVSFTHAYDIKISPRAIEALDGPDEITEAATTTDSDEDNSGSSDNSNSDSSDDDDEDEEDEEDEEERKERTRTEVRANSGFEVEIEREVEFDDDGKKVIKIKRKITSADGTETEVEIKITSDGVTKTIKIETNDGDLEVESELEVTQSEDGREITITQADGEVISVDILPDEALEIARQRLRFRGRFRNLNESDISMNLEEITHNNIPRVVYNIQANQNGRFLGIFKLAMDVEAQVDPETGEVITASRPWWAFLVSVDEDQTSDDSTPEDTTEGDGNGSNEDTDSEGSEEPTA